MHIKFLNRGQGKGSAATNYIMSEKDHTKKVRHVPPIVLRGNPKTVGALADSLDFKHKYRSCVIAFHPDDKPTNEQLEEVLNSFEKVAFAGLDQDQYTFTAVLHREAESEHIHIIVPRVELSTGNSMNIAPPGWKNTYDPLRDLFNEKYEWTSPDISLNPEISRITQPRGEGTYKSKSAVQRAEIKQSIEEYLIDEIREGNIENHDDVKLGLMSLGFEIPRAGKDYITVLDPETKNRTRLKGAIYEKSWRLEQSFEATSRAEAQGDRGDNQGRIGELERELENRISERAEYNLSRYSQPEPIPKSRPERAPQPSDENEKDTYVGMDTAPIGSPPDLFSHLVEQLGSDAISFQPHSIAVNRDESERTKNNDSRIPFKSNQPEQVRRPDVRPNRSKRRRVPRWLQDFKNKIGDLYDRTRTAIDERIRAFIVSIRAGHDAVAAASDDLDEASESLEQSISGNSQIIERGVRKLRDNRNDELEKFKTHINLVEYAASQGYKLIKKDSSKNSKALKHPGGDKIIVATDMDGHGVYFSAGNGDSGSIIDFIQNRQNLNLGQVRKELRSFSGFTDIEDYKSLSKPIKSSKDTAKAAYVLAQATITDEHPYLINERKISRETLKDLRFERSVKIDARNNALFPHFNSEGVAGYEIKNTSFTGYAKGGEKGLWYSSNIMRAERVVIVESAIDALSHAELNPSWQETAYVSIGGSMSPAQLELIKTVIEGKETVIATDNDKNGNHYADQIKELSINVTREVANNKDWNDDLKKKFVESDNKIGIEI